MTRRSQRRGPRLSRVRKKAGSPGGLSCDSTDGGVIPSEASMRGSDQRSGSLFSYVDLEARVRADHPLRPIRAIVRYGA